MTGQEGDQGAAMEPKEIGYQLMRTAAWLAVAAVVALVGGLCFLVLYLMGMF